jgi:hypothetical protein
MLHLHSFVKIGIGSQCGLLRDVVDAPGIGIPSDCVGGILSEVVNRRGIVGVGKGIEMVSGSSAGSIGPSCGCGIADASTTRAPDMIAQRMVRSLSCCPYNKI